MRASLNGAGPESAFAWQRAGSDAPVPKAAEDSRTPKAAANHSMLRNPLCVLECGSPLPLWRCNPRPPAGFSLLAVFADYTLRCWSIIQQSANKAPAFNTQPARWPSRERSLKIRLNSKNPAISLACTRIAQFIRSYACGKRYCLRYQD